MRKKEMPYFPCCANWAKYGIFRAVKREKAKRQSFPPSETPKVLVSISLAHASWRNFLSGILRYVDEHANWDIRILPEPGNLTAEQIDDAERENFAGIILATPGNIDFNRLNRSTIPLAACGGWGELNRRTRNIVHVGFDSAAHGATGAKHLLSRGRYAAYGFVRSRFDMGWSESRQKSFVQTILAAGGNAVCYELPHGVIQGKDVQELRDWLLSLPKPAAVMADCDRRAAQAVAACRDGGMSVPRDVAVLGVDDDAFYALHTRPPLSSVEPGHAEGGYRLAAELDRLIKARRPSLAPKKVVIHPKGVVARESTRPIGTSAALVRRAAAFVIENASNGIKVADVVRHLGCSRRIVELRFIKERGQTVSDFITEKRLEEVKRRLAASSATVSEIASECGFKTAAHLSHLFKRRFGQSIRDWRSALPPQGSTYGRQFRQQGCGRADSSLPCTDASTFHP